MPFRPSSLHSPPCRPFTPISYNSQTPPSLSPTPSLPPSPFPSPFMSSIHRHSDLSLSPRPPRIMPFRSSSIDFSVSPVSSEHDPGSPRASNSDILDFKQQSHLLVKSFSARSLGMPKGKVERVMVERPMTPGGLPRSRVFIQGRGRVEVESASSEEDDDAFYESASEEREGEEEEDGQVGGKELGRVGRVLSSLRSISFQNSVLVEDIDTAWGQVNGMSISPNDKRGMGLYHNDQPAVASIAQGRGLGSRWRRPRGRISSKNGVLEFPTDFAYSEADASAYVYHHTPAMGARDKYGARGYGGRVIPNKSLWNGRKDRRGYLAATTDPNVVGKEVVLVERVGTEEERRRASVDKYVEFIQVSAKRESRGKGLRRGFGGRFVQKAQMVFRRRRR